MATPDPEPERRESPFWRFSLSLYARPGVPPACLVLQDGSAVDVNVLLFLLWLAREGRVVEGADVAAILGTVAPWKQDVVVPLRTARRTLKEPPAAFATPAAEALRSRVKAVELEAERLQQEALHAMHRGAGEADGADLAVRARQNLAAYAVALGVAFPDASVNAILAALEQVTA